MEMKVLNLTQYVIACLSVCLAGNSLIYILRLAAVGGKCLGACLVTRNSRLYGFLIWKGAKKSWHRMTTTGDDSGRRRFFILFTRNRVTVFEDFTQRG